MKLRIKTSRILTLTCASFSLFTALAAQDLEWQEWNGHWYAATSSAGTWAECRADARVHGGELVSLGDSLEEAFILAQFGFGAFWIGLSDDDIGTGWSNGDGLTYQNWRALLPFEIPQESGCSVMNLTQFGWIKVSCGEVFPAIIERDTDPFGPVVEDTDSDGPEIEDTDGDGVVDSEDSCPESNTHATIVFGACDSGVENFAIEEGCFLADALQQIANEAKNRGQLIRQMIRFTRKLRVEGRLSAQERINILRCVVWGEKRPCQKERWKRQRTGRLSRTGRR